MSAALRAVADVNVLVSAARSPNGVCGGLLADATDGRWIPVVSVLLVEELEEVLARPKFRDVLGQETTDRFLADLLDIAEWAQDPEASASPATRDPDDEYLVALARSADVDALISGDRDLTDLPEAEPPIETPAQSRSASLGYSRISICGVTIEGPTPVAPVLSPRFAGSFYSLGMRDDRRDDSQ